MISMPVSIRPLNGAMGGEIVAVDPGLPAAAAAQALMRALAEFGLLVCPEGSLLPAVEAGLANALAGEGRFHCAATGGLAPIHLVERMDPAWRKERPALLFLRAVRVPPEGGESIWSSFHAAYRGLSVPMRHYLAPLHAGHGRYEGHAEVWRPLIAPHPVSGLACLDFSPDFTRQIAGVPEEEARLILKLLRNHLYTPENQLRIPWREGMFVIWDCRLAHHYPVGGFAAAGWRLSGFSARPA